MKLKKRYVLLPAAALLLVLLLVNVWNSARGIKVEAVSVESGTIEDYYTEEGVLSFGQEYTVIAKAGGAIKEIYVEENTQVKKGDVLFVIDDRNIQYEKIRNESALKVLRAQLDQTRINQVVTTSPQEYISVAGREAEARAADYQMAKTIHEASGILYAEGSISKLEWEQNKAIYETARAAWSQAIERHNQSQELLATLAGSGIKEAGINARFYESEIDSLNAEIKSAEAAVAQITDELEDCTVIADQDGVVVSLPIKEMSVIQAGQAAVVVSVFDQMEAHAQVLTSIAPYLQPEDPVTVTLALRGRDHIYQGTIKEVYNFASKGVSTLGLDEYLVQVKVAVEDSQELKSMNGYDVTLRFLLYYGEDRLWVPASAVFQSDGQDYVLLISGGRAVKTPVETEYQTGSQAVITAGIAAGERVIKNVDEEGVFDGGKVYE